VVDRVKCSSSPCKIWLAVSHTVCAHVGGLKNRGTLGPALGEYRTSVTNRNPLLHHMLYHNKFCRFRSNRLVVDRGPKMGGRWDPAILRWGRGWPLEICFSPNCITMPNSVILGQTGTSVIMENSHKILIPRVPPFTVTHWNRHGSIGYPWLLRAYRIRKKDKKR